MNRALTRRSPRYCMHCDTQFTATAVYERHKLDIPDENKRTQLGGATKTCPERLASTGYWMGSPKKPTDIKMIECYLGKSIPTSVWCHNPTRCAFECHWCPGQWFNPKDFSSPTHLVDLVQMLSNDPIRVARFRV
ncbi:hypothetical protein BT69DRAFT_987569 [Atractiella rhizophila]|nr:hypothetical protein BT69DRAFT_987569 [Atractiella rhizophila]